MQYALPSCYVLTLKHSSLKVESLSQQWNPGNTQGLAREKRSKHTLPKLACPATFFLGGRGREGHFADIHTIRESLAYSTRVANNQYYILNHNAATLNTCMLGMKRTLNFGFE